MYELLSLSQSMSSSASVVKTSGHKAQVSDEYIPYHEDSEKDWVNVLWFHVKGSNQS